jgi:4-hydroxy-tetrahydrodipicolinate reductase
VFDGNFNCQSAKVISGVQRIPKQSVSHGKARRYNLLTMTNAQNIKVAVHGAAGRVGREVLRAVDAAPDMTLVAAIDRVPLNELKPLPANVPYYTDARIGYRAAGADVVVDFSIAAASFPMVPLALAAGTRPVIGTTGFTKDQISFLSAQCLEHQLGGLLAPNFTIGAVLLGTLAAMAAPYFDYVDIYEEHHEMKVDAPSGTALGIAKSIQDAHPEAFTHNEPAREPLSGTRGGNYNGMSIHSSRMPGRMAHHQVTFGGAGQTLMLRHDTNNRECYMPGVLLAVRKVMGLEGLTVGLDKLMGL